jgi:hypothetical protein
LREKIEAENEAKGEIQRTMSRAMAEAQIWKAKYTTEAVARIEDLENARGKLLVTYFKQDFVRFFNFLREIPQLTKCATHPLL